MAENLIKFYDYGYKLGEKSKTAKNNSIRTILLNLARDESNYKAFFQRIMLISEESEIHIPKVLLLLIDDKVSNKEKELYIYTLLIGLNNSVTKRNNKE